MDYRYHRCMGRQRMKDGRNLRSRRMCKTTFAFFLILIRCCRRPFVVKEVLC
jgi:hypothetical protein